MQMIFPNIIEALTVVFGVSRYIRGEMFTEDPSHTIAYTELYAIMALSEDMENGPVLVVRIDDEANNPYKQIDMIPDILDDADFVFHIYDGLIVEPTSEEEKAMVEAYMLNRDIGLNGMEKPCVICNIYNKSEVMARATATQCEYIAFYEKNRDNENGFPDSKLPDRIDALWSLNSPDSINTMSDQSFNQKISEKMSDIQWN